MAGKYIVLLGSPASGKTYEARRLSEKLGLPIISASELLREFCRISSNEEKIARVQQAMAEGALGLDDILMPMVRQRLRFYPQGAIIEGVPRTRDQAVMLDDILRQESQALSAVISLEGTTIEVARERSSHGLRVFREDNIDQVLQRRFDIYTAESPPILQYYGKPPKKILLQVNAVQPLKSMEADIDGALATKDFTFLAREGREDDGRVPGQ